MSTASRLIKGVSVGNSTGMDSVEQIALYLNKPTTERMFNSLRKDTHKITLDKSKELYKVNQLINTKISRKTKIKKQRAELETYFC